ncbi:hypothetical protein [Galbibacter sp.]|uniref:hypothetical protein n=1 Tax=Galbibacter sp. TaxID=2918471 RepID=UPI003A957D88
MKTFNEELKEFNKRYSYVNLYVPITYSEKDDKYYLWYGVFFFASIISGGIIFNLSQYKLIGYSLMIFPALPVIIYVFIIKTYRARKELKSQGLPCSKVFWEWKSDELEDIRIKKAFKKYSELDNPNIKKRIVIAKELISEPLNNPFKFFDKLLEFIGKQFLIVLIAVFLFLYKADSTSENLTSLLGIIITILLMAAIMAFVWEHIFKKAYFDSKQVKREQIKDYIFVLENILLMKESASKKKRCKKSTSSKKIVS